MPATLLFYRAADSDARPEHFGAVVSGPPRAHHDQARLGEDGLPDFNRWQLERPDEAQFWGLEPTRPPYFTEQAEFLGLPKTFIPPL